MPNLLAGKLSVLTSSLCHDLLHLSGIICKNILKEMCVLPIFVFSVTPREKTLVVGSSDLSIRTLTQKLCGCKRGEGGQHGLQLLLLCPQNHLPGCGWESAKGGSESSANTFCVQTCILFKLLIYVLFIFWRKQCHIMKMGLIKGKRKRVKGSLMQNILTYPVNVVGILYLKHKENSVLGI